MTPDETRQLLKRRFGYTSQGFGDGMVAQWHDRLAGIPYADACQALDHAARTQHRLTLADCIPARTDRRPYDLAPLACPHCDGTGFVFTVDDRADRCDHPGATVHPLTGRPA